MEEDSEVLDWGNEDDETQMSESGRAQSQQKQADSGGAWTSGEQEAEDAVSLGGDEDEEVYPYPNNSTSQEHTSPSREPSPRPPSRQRASADYRHDQREDSSNSVKPPSRKTEAQPLQRAQSLSKLTHALPPKPIVAPPPYIPPAIVHPSTLASSMVYRDRRSNGHPKQLSSSQDAFDALPSDWEVRYPRNGGREAYYYNVRTHESTWTRPGPMSSGRSSPSKERDSDSIHLGGSRSPIRGLTDDSARMRTDKRRTSPGGTLTYEDRHYRPEGSSGPEVQVQVDRRDSYSTSPRSHGRPLSPPLRVDERRAPRSPSPALRRRSRSMERSGRGSRRDISPSASDLNAWREATRGDYPSRHPPVQERAWGRPRNMSPPENNPVRSFDDRSTAPRGRRHRMDVEPPAQSLPIPQDTRNNSNNEWSASRHRSPPPHLREPSPPRRPPPSDLPQRPPSPSYFSRFERAPSPIPPREISRALPESPPPVANIPQRRPRDDEPVVAISAKRQRMNEWAIESARQRQLLRGEIPSLPPAFMPMPDKPLSTSVVQPLQPEQSDQHDQPRLQKRLPLPPQSARFREASRTVPQPQLPPIPAPSNFQARPPRQPVDDAGQTGAGRSYRDIPSGPRSQVQLPQEQSGANSTLRPVSGTGRTRTRFDAPLPGAPLVSNVSGLPDHGRDNMDNDYYPKGSASRTDDASSRSAAGIRNERPPPESHMSALPTGPRAMSRTASAFGAQQAFTGIPPVPPPPQNVGFNPRALPSNTSPKTGPPPSRSARERVESYQGQSSTSFTQAPRGVDGGKGNATDTVIDRGRGLPEPSDGKNQDSRIHRVSGTNNIPLANRRSFGAQDPPDLPLARNDNRRDDRRGVDSNAEVIIYETEQPRRPPMPTYNPVSPPSHYRTLSDVVDNTPRIPPGERRDVPMTNERTSNPSVNSIPVPRTGKDEPPRRQGERSGRQSRFGPAEPPPAEPRMWLTREESQTLLARSEFPSQSTRNARAPEPRAHSSRYNEASSRQDSTVGNEPLLSQGRVQERNGSPPRGRSQERFPDSRQRARGASFERRVSAQTEPSSGPPYRSDQVQGEFPRGRERGAGRNAAYQDSRSQPVLNDDRYPPRSYPDEHTSPSGQAWSHSGEVAKDTTSVKVHPDRVRLFGDPATQNHRETRASEHDRWPDTSPHTLPIPLSRDTSPPPKTSKTPIRMRRPDKSPTSEQYVEHQLPQDNEDGRSATPPQRPPVQRGGSLLDRLTLDSPPQVATPTLRERVEIPMKRPGEDIHGLPPRPSIDVTSGAESSLDARGGRVGRRRTGKVKKGRR